MSLNVDQLKYRTTELFFFFFAHLCLESSACIIANTVILLSEVFSKMAHVNLRSCRMFIFSITLPVRMACPK